MTSRPLFPDALVAMLQKKWTRSASSGRSVCCVVLCCLLFVVVLCCRFALIRFGEPRKCSSLRAYLTVHQLDFSMHLTVYFFEVYLQTVGLVLGEVVLTSGSHFVHFVVLYSHTTTRSSQSAVTHGENRCGWLGGWLGAG